jgi:hypothetical protein
MNATQNIFADLIVLLALLIKLVAQQKLMNAS